MTIATGELLKLEPDQPCPCCGRYQNRPTAANILCIRGNTILLGKRKRPPFEGQWGLLGGFVNHGETIRAAVKREMLEETGQQATIVQELSRRDDPARDPQQCIAYPFVVTIDPEADPVAMDDVAELRWFSLDQLPEQLAFDHQLMIEEYVHSRAA